MKHISEKEATMLRLQSAARLVGYKIEATKRSFEKLSEALSKIDFKRK